MRKEDLLWNLWVELCAAYRDAKIDLVKAIQAAKTSAIGLALLNKYNAINLNYSRALVFATDENLRTALLTCIRDLKDLSYVKMPVIDDLVQAFLEGKAGRPFVSREEV